jgi:hypothetical protein
MFAGLAGPSGQEEFDVTDFCGSPFNANEQMGNVYRLGTRLYDGNIGADKERGG